MRLLGGDVTMAVYTKATRNEVANRLRYFARVGCVDARDLAYCVEPTGVRGIPLEILADMVSTPEQLQPDERRAMIRRLKKLATTMRDTADVWKGKRVPCNAVTRWADRIEEMADAG